MSFSNAEADRRAGDAVKVGKIQSVDAGSATAIVDFGDMTSPPLSVNQMRAGALSFWWMPEVGEQVIVACESGEIANGVILGSIFKGNAPSSDPAEPMIALSGARLVIDGDLHVTGNITCDGDVTASGVSLVTHTHPHGDPETGAPS